MPKIHREETKDTLGDLKIPIPFTDIKIPINRKELGIFLIGIIVGMILTIGALSGINFIFG